MSRFKESLQHLTAYSCAQDDASFINFLMNDNSSNLDTIFTCIDALNSEFSEFSTRLNSTVAFQNGLSTLYEQLANKSIVITDYRLTLNEGYKAWLDEQGLVLGAIDNRIAQNTIARTPTVHLKQWKKLLDFFQILQDFVNRYDLTKSFVFNRSVQTLAKIQEQKIQALNRSLIDLVRSNLAKIILKL